MGLPAAVVVSGVASAAATTAAAATAPGMPSGRLRLPLEQELSMMNEFQAGLETINSDIDLTYKLYEEFTQRLDTIDEGLKGSMPSDEVFKQLQDQTTRLTLSMGSDLQRAIDRGFLTKDVQQELSDLRAVEAETFVDPEQERFLQEERAKLEQDLARSGVGPAQRAQALRQFDKHSDEARFRQINEMRTGKTQRGISRIGAELGARGQGFQEAMAQYGAVSGTTEAYRGARFTGLSGLGQSASARAEAGAQGIAARLGLQESKMGQFAQLGQFDFSKGLQQALAGGLVGPGSSYEQTGVARDYLKEYQQQYSGMTGAISSGEIGVEASHPMGYRGVPGRAVNTSQAEYYRKALEALQGTVEPQGGEGNG